MKCAVTSTIIWGGKPLPPGTWMAGAAADYVWSHPLLKKNVVVVPDSIKDDHHPAAITDVPASMADRGPKKEKPEVAVRPAAPAPQPPAAPAALKPGA